VKGEKKITEEVAGHTEHTWGCKKSKELRNRTKNCEEEYFGVKGRLI